MMPWQQGMQVPNNPNKAVAGRPKKVGKPLFARTNMESSGFTPTFDVDPQVLNKTHTGQLAQQKLPPGLAPTNMKLPGPIATMRNRSISRGWAKRAGGGVN